MRVTLLGSVAAEADGVAVPLGGRRQRAVFAMLALNAGRVVSVDHLIRVLWDDDPPARAAMALQSMISRLRRVLGTQPSDDGAAVRILTRPPGWVLDLEAEAVDATRFAAGIAEGRRLLSVGEPATAAQVLSETLALWPGQAAGQLEIADFAREDAAALEQARLDACELLFTAQLTTGETQVVVEEARRFVAENPFRERAWMSLSLGLYRGGRQADALAAIAELRTTLADGLGLDPSTEVAALEQQILSHNSGLQGTPDPLAFGVSPGTRRNAIVAGHQAPANNDNPTPAPEPAVVGRADVFALLDEVLAQAASGRGRVVLVQGVAGIGKSTVLRALDSRAGGEGVVVIHGAGVSESPAFWPWLTVVRELVATLPGLVDSPSVTVLAKIDPAFSSAPGRTVDGPAGGDDLALGRTRLYRAAVDLLVVARRTAPLVVVIDDVQAVDEETAGLLAVAMPELTAHGVLFVLGVGIEEGQDASARVERFLEGVRRDAVVRITLANLTADEVAEMIATQAHNAADPAVSQAVWMRSSGNPLLVTELARQLDREDRLDPDRVQLILPGELGGGPRRRPDRLPTVPSTRLYGRDGDVAEAARLVRSGRSRVVTLTGMGGVGKTRLAAAVADEIAGDYPGGVVSVALSALVDVDQVVSSIAEGLGVHGAAQGVDMWEPVTAHLSGRRLLLVLDNFEHLLGAATQIANVVSRCPGVTVLVTSRSALRIREEHEYVVRPLSLPTSWTSPEALAESASGAFVLQRARELGPPLRLDAAEAHALGQLCHRLGGLPLAIELATAHFRFLSPQDVLDRLDDLPGSAPRDLPERQQTMRATLDWSSGLLSVKQRALFSVFGAFHGGATLTTLEQVAAASGTVQAGDVLTLLQALIEHSLVLVTEDDFGRRYGMLEPVSQYARRLLVEDEAARIEAAHADVFLGLAEQAAAGYEGPDQVRWLDRVQADEANLLVAIDRCLDAEDGGRAARIIWAMWIFWWLRARPTAGRRRAVRCLSLPLPATARARVHLTAAVLSYAEADLRASAEHWAAGYELGMQEGDREIACAGRAGCGLAALGEGDVDAAETLFREALRLGEEAGPSGLWLRSLIYVWLGTILLVKGQPDAAAVQTERGLALARTRGDRLATYVALYNASQAAMALDDPDLARKRLTEGIILSQQTQDLANLGYFLDALGVVEATEDAPERAAVMFGAAQAMREAAGGKVYGYYLPDQSLRRKAEEQVRDALGEAAFGDAVEAGRSLDADQSVMFAAAPVPAAAAANVRGHGSR